MGTRVVGRTRYRQWPPTTVGKVPVVSGTKKVDVRRLMELRPDMIVAVKEENSRENVEKIQVRRRAGLSAPRRAWRALWFLRWLAEVVEVPRVEVVLGLIERVYGRLREDSPL